MEQNSQNQSQPSWPETNKSTMLSVSVKMAAYVPVDMQSYKVGNQKWISRGPNNTLSRYYIELYNSSPDHHRYCHAIAQMIAGKGVQDELVKQETIDSISLDLKLQGGYYWEIILTMDGSDIAQINHLPFECVSLNEHDEYGKINGVWFSKDFQNIRKYKPKFIPLWPGRKILSDSSNENRRFVAWSFLPTPGSLDYPNPDYASGIDCIDTDRRISRFQNTHVRNNFTPSAIITFRNGDPGEEGRKAIEKNISNAIGEDNTSRVIINYIDPTAEPPQVDTFQVNDIDKQYEGIGSRTDEKILTVHAITSPLLFGKRPPSGFGSNKEEMQEALNILMLNTIKPYQKMITDDLEEILGRPIIIEPNVLTFQVAAEPQKTALSAEVIEMDANDSKFWIERLEKLGEVVDLDEWEIYGEADVVSAEGERIYNEAIKEFKEANLFAEYAEPGEKSEIDTGLFKVRYKYTGRVTSKTRDFCRFMMDDSRAGTVYRIEDIDAMSFNGVNGQFAPAGSSSYSILDHKGGVYCHHKWTRVVYKRRREKGKFLPNDGLNNDELTKERPRTLKPIGKEAVRPIDTPSRGSLKYG